MFTRKRLLVLSNMEAPGINRYFFILISNLFSLIFSIFAPNLALGITCYSGDWSKPESMTKVDCDHYCGIILRQNKSVLYSEANCYRGTDFKHKSWKKILLNLSDERLPRRVAFYLCRTNLCNRKSKLIHLRARYTSRALRSSDHRHVMLSVDDDDQSKTFLEHRKSSFSYKDSGALVVGTESNFTVNQVSDRDGAEAVYRESTKVERSEGDQVKKYRQTFVFFEGPSGSNLTDGSGGGDPPSWRMFQ